jgi:hypothetical protein
MNTGPPLPPPHPAMESHHYFLAQDCFVCRSRDHWIVLNATRDRYLCITRRDLSQIGDRLHGWRDHSESAAPLASLDAEAEATIASLMASGVLTTDQAQGKPFATAQSLRP